jgi:hypothetical protein
MSERVGLAVIHSLRSARQRPDTIPFELRILEVLLAQSVKYLEDKAQKIKLLSRAVQEHVNRHVSAAEIRRLLPLQKAVTALEYDIREMKHAVAEVPTLAALWHSLAWLPSAWLSSAAVSSGCAASAMVWRPTWSPACKGRASQHRSSRHALNATQCAGCRE